ncbi:MAG TPA: hypothetical protein VHK65_10855 [Candidatus Dormibacteraeota bacterium]|nr:hypothetical protein [Candidatus Dormibacteraeota bacterium]
MQESGNPAIPGTHVPPTGQQTDVPVGEQEPAKQIWQAALLTQLQAPPWQISLGPQALPQALQLSWLV